MFNLIHSPTELQNFVLFFGDIHLKNKEDIFSFGGYCIPTGCSYIGIQSKGRLNLILGNQKVATTKSYVSRQVTMPYQLDTDDDEVYITSAILTPTALYHLFGIENNKYVNENGSLEEIFDDSNNLISKTFPDNGTSQERINWLTNLLLEQVQKKAIQLNIIDIAVKLIMEEKGMIPINELVNKLNISERYFQKQFKRMVGLSPSVYCNIIRFMNVFSEMGTTKTSELSAAFNFYDLAHFSKAFKAFTGTTPSEFEAKDFPFLYHTTIENTIWINPTKK